MRGEGIITCIYLLMEVNGLHSTEATVMQHDTILSVN